MNTNLVGPDTSNTPYFTLTTSLIPDELASASTLLLNAVKVRPKLTQAFRLEVKFLQDFAEFRICLDPVLWYDVYLRINPSLTEVVKIARDYVTTTRMSIPPEEDGPFVVDYEETEKDKAYIPCSISREPHKLKKPKDKECEYDHPEFICEGSVITRDGRDTTCNYYFPTKLIVQELNVDNYIVLLRREPIRELLLLPRPNKDKANYNHFDNEMLLQRSEFWKDLLEQQQRLNFHTIAVNYGRWETGQSRDKYAQACHAHIHLLFTSETWEGVKRMVTNKETLSKLNARNYPGPNYLLKDCMELEQQRLQSAEHQCMLASVAKLSETSESVNNSLVNAITSLSTAVSSLNKHVEILIKKDERDNQEKIIVGLDTA
ncbi:hypothetical protein RclHR1_05140020 [Rhizophagus clarus]|uniref:Uncharacterized protein n=1 Tax=Rhizophagus clarus TaxID=94130 RepID=A0A2Z6RL27_9GLOM|nr:hypothetical protein RclHR1_05140020 [Rhizophagus clarus]